MTEISENKFDSLNTKVDDLINLCTEMKQENQVLKVSETKWLAERKQLLERNQEAKAKLESILIRLKAMDIS
ncbi:MAG: TIGR02449 family protein [Gammaproteobacteria bacterium]|nr:TIGR02449 family protein [Gammaproteobacteria bacterium]|tara:strand:- start:437 stop:652 length:216 start_codon:yes stop_codon:yes gene_type:complete